MFERAIVAGDQAGEEPGEPGPPGCLMVIGGAEDRAGDCGLLRVFATLCGGTSARIVLITTASGVPAQSFGTYLAAFRRLGIRDIRELRLGSREQADGERARTALARATGVFFTGGDQARLGFLVGSDANRALRGRMADNSLVLAGTSAGATALGPVMILGGDVRASDHYPDDQEAGDPGPGGLRLGPGLGLLPAAIIDVHFTQRRRLPRLVAAVTRHPSHLGIGIDEDTAILVRSGRFSVLGRGRVVTVDTVPALVDSGGRVLGLRLHRLYPDDAFDLDRRHPLQPGR